MKRYAVCVLAMIFMSYGVLAADEDFFAKTPGESEFPEVFAEQPSVLQEPAGSLASDENVPDPLDEESFLFRGSMPVNRVIVNISFDTTGATSRLIPQRSSLDTSIAYLQLLPNVKSDAGLYAVCDRYLNFTGGSQFPRGSSALVYISALSPSLKCPKTKYVQFEVAYQVKNVGLATVRSNGTKQECDAPWSSPLSGKTGKEKIETPFMQDALIVPYPGDRRVSGVIVIPVRSDQPATDFNGFHYTSPKSLLFEAFRGDDLGDTEVSLTVIRCTSRKALPSDSISRVGDSLLLGTPQASFGMKVGCWFSFIRGEKYGVCVERKLHEKLS